MIMNLYTYNTRTTFYFSDINVVMFFIFVLVISYMAAAVASLAFEAPMIGLEKILLHKDKTKSDAGKRNAPNEQA
nr:hypothetical protein BaRGS_027397 [Batillaria attramentaria]